MRSIKPCMHCQNNLILKENWSASNAESKYYICSSCFKKKRREMRPATRRWSGLQKPHALKVTNFFQDAIRRGREVFLTFNEVAEIMSKPCTYCGGFSNSHNLNGLDRIDSALEYTKENSAPCCTKCNYGKNKWSVEEYLEHVRKVVAFQNLKDGRVA